MGCNYWMCACNSIHGTCRWSGNPKTCAYGKDAREKRLAFLRGYRAGRAKNKEKNMTQKTATSGKKEGEDDLPDMS